MTDQTASLPAGTHCDTRKRGGDPVSSAAHLPPGVKAQILRAVIAERHPKIALPAIAHRFGVTYDVVRLIIDQAGYPDAPRMRETAIELELAEHASQVAAETIEQLADAGDSAPQVKLQNSKQDAGDETDEQLVNVRLNELHIDPDNVRKLPSPNDDDIVELADSIAEVGLLQPIVARRETTTGDGGLRHVRLVVVMGHRRLVALQRLKWTSCKVIIRGPMLAGDVLAAMLIENGQRRDLNPIEEARGLRRLQIDMSTDEHQATDVEVARRVGRSSMHVAGRIMLLSLPADQQAAIAAGEMSLTEGVAKGRLATGRLGQKGVDRNWHLGPLHPLAEAAKARCRRLQHLRGRTIGGMACGECWESVIRADTRADFVDVAHKIGTCPVCDAPVERQAVNA